MAHRRRFRVSPFLETDIIIRMENLKDDIDVLDYLNLIRKEETTSRLDELRWHITDQRNRIHHMEEQVSKGEIEMSEEDWKNEEEYLLELVEQFDIEVKQISLEQEEKNRDLEEESMTKYRYNSRIEPVEFRRKEKQLKEILQFDSVKFPSFVKENFTETELQEFHNRLETFVRFPFKNIVESQLSEGFCELNEKEEERMKKKKLFEVILDMIDMWREPLKLYHKSLIDEFSKDDERPLFIRLLLKLPVDVAQFNLLTVKQISDFGIKVKCFIEKVSNYFALQHVSLRLGIESSDLDEEKEMERLEEKRRRLMEERDLMMEETKERVDAIKDLLLFVLEPSIVNYLSFDEKLFISLCSFGWDATTGKGPWTIPMLQEINEMIDGMKRRMAEEKYDPFGEMSDPEEEKEQRLYQYSLVLYAFFLARIDGKGENLKDPLYRFKYHKEFEFVILNRFHILRGFDLIADDIDDRVEMRLEMLLRKNFERLEEEEKDILKDFEAEMSYGERIQDEVKNKQEERKEKLNSTPQKINNLS
uniref:RING-type domain-containing protein n=1 Tax=Caenorhabditis tropicalis TaxID=1561998 RepID=A0A1I7TTZ8_9PELO